MALSNSQYQEIMREYQAQQLRDKHAQDARVEEIYQKIPAIRELDQEVSTRALLRAKELLNGDKAALERLREEIADLREQKAFLLASKGYPADYMECLSGDSGRAFPKNAALFTDFSHEPPGPGNSFPGQTGFAPFVLSAGFGTSWRGLRCFQPLRSPGR